MNAWPFSTFCTSQHLWGASPRAPTHLGSPLLAPELALRHTGGAQYMHCWVSGYGAPEGQSPEIALFPADKATPLA